MSARKQMNSLPKHWEFYKDSSHRWQWRKFQGEKVVAVSGDGFQDRKKCIEDAMQRGYVAPAPEPSQSKVSS
jgi:hypothetical protein